VDIWFVLKIIWAFALVALLLLALTYVVRSLARGRLLVATERRLVTVVESTLLAQNVTVHVLKIADKYYLVGGGAGGVSLIDEVPATVVDPWMDGHKRALTSQRDAVLGFVGRFRKS
jgi:flagellar biogenesis protein FliO